jgi:gas vesicle protein
MKSGKVLLGILAGAGIGALVGMLYAPEKGSTTRKNITSKKDDFADSLKEKLNDFVDSYAKKYEKAYSTAKNVLTEGESKLSEMSKGLVEKKEVIA